MQSIRKKSFAAEQLAKRQQQKKSPVTIAIIVLAVVIVVGAISYALYVRFGAKEEPTEAVTPSVKDIESIAVLPFVNMSADPDQEYFCDGLADDIILALTNVRTLHVLARTSSFAFKGQDKDIREIGRDLEVDAVFEGSVSKSGTRLRINAQLINVATGYHILSEQYNYEMVDVLDIRDDISMKIVEKLKIELGEKEKTAIEKRYTENTEAWNLYKRGRYHWNKRSEEELKKALQYFQEAIEIDSTYALAYVGIADSYNALGFWGYMYPREAYPRVKDAAEKALNIDDTLAEAHVSLASYYLDHDWDWNAAEREFKKALNLKPDYSTAHQWYSDYLLITGRLEESLAEAHLALKLDPLSPIVNFTVAYRLLFLKKYDESMEQSLKTVELHPNFGYIYWNIGNIYLEQDNYTDAVTNYEKALKLIQTYIGDKTWKP